MVVWSPNPFGLGRNGCWPFRGYQLSRVLPSHKPFFLLCCSLNDRRRAAHRLFEIGPLFLFSPASLARLLIFLLLMMSGNVHPNPGPIFPCSVRADNETWRGRSVQCCTCSKRVRLKCLLFSFSKFKTYEALTLGVILSAASLLLLEIPHLPTLCLPLWTPPACVPPLCYLLIRLPLG